MTTVELFIGSFVFCLVLFLYIHVQYHLKTSNDLNIYEVDNVAKDQLEELCAHRQPVLLYDLPEASAAQATVSAAKQQYGAFEVAVSDTKGHQLGSVSLSSLMAVLEANAGAFSENNAEFLTETGILKSLQATDEMLRPSMVSNCEYDVVMSHGQTVATPARYELNFRHYMLVTSGKIQVKLAPPKSSKFLRPVADYEQWLFTSPVDMWNTQPEFAAEFSKVKCLEFVVEPGQTLFVPAYWWYSVRFLEPSDLVVYRYRTYMNNVAILPQMCMYALQLQNTKTAPEGLKAPAPVEEKKPSEPINQQPLPIVLEEHSMSASMLDSTPI